MPSNFQVNTTDLDNIFKPRNSVKRADVGYMSGSTDISNFYEKSVNPYDRATAPTNYIFNVPADIVELFQSKDFYVVSNSDAQASVITHGESQYKYWRTYDGSLYVTINTTYCKPVGGVFRFQINANGSIVNQTVASTETSTVIGLGGLAYGTYTVWAQDLNSGSAKAVSVYVGYGGGQQGGNPPIYGPYYFP